MIMYSFVRVAHLLGSGGMKMCDRKGRNIKGDMMHFHIIYHEHNTKLASVILGLQSGKPASVCLNYGTA